jgi:hypothetical protein
MQTSASTSLRTLAIIRAALLAGVLVFGALCWVVTNQRGGGPRPGTDPAAFALFRVVVPALCLGAIALATVLRGAVSRQRDPQKRVPLRIVGWALGEGAALAGGIYFLELGDPKLYVLGVVAMLATFIILPLRET